MRDNLTIVKKIKKASNSEEIFTSWSKLVTGVCFYLIYATILAYTGLFNMGFLLGGLLIIIFLSGSFNSIVLLFRAFFLENFDFLRFLLTIVWIVWFLLLIVYSSFPAFSGRDEGSYANAALYLERFHDVEFHLPLLDHLKSEGLAHQSLNFPGFVIKNNNLTSQFSPAYSVLLGISYTFTKIVAIFTLVNGFLILGGSVAFYLIIRQFAPRWFAASGLIALIFSFVFLWFPRFTFSENLAFFLFFNLIYFLFLLRKTSNLSFIYPVTGLVILFPLVRPEGWWLFFATIFLLSFWYLKGLIEVSKDYLVKFILVLAGGLIFSAYVIYDQLPVYKRLVRDWIEWPSTAGNYANVMGGKISFADFYGIITALFPSPERFMYFLKVEWNYGVLVFGIVAAAALSILLLDKDRKIFSNKIRSLLGIVAFLSFPFFSAFISPQISTDHPWMLRRFFFVVLPCGILAFLMLVLAYAKRFPQRYPLPLISLLLAFMLLPSISASTYFLTVKTDTGREEALYSLAKYFSQDDFIFFSREASGDGWRMWSESLSSLYGKNAAYVYSPENIVSLRQVILDRFSQGHKSFVVLPERAFDFEHELGKTFNLIPEKEASFNNLQLVIKKGSFESGFPPLENREQTVKIYLLTPR